MNIDLLLALSALSCLLILRTMGGSAVRLGLRADLVRLPSVLFSSA